ncbi:hypothetical protein BDY21DRAFT_412758 [Lineolata rhizophorae]|uniref:FAD-binding domain-containing protein n=1 Tax=Lineolata rhizophorae TaxID=578093 RepID=A0A6A6PER8_9PEZI|nr:hypothetical protein BDY21DRAFT_412758 [Lineolata rhizophorae]
MTVTVSRPFKVAIAGAGPSGLLLALLLAKHGIQVVVLEATDKLDEQPRACHYAPSSNIELERAGVLQDIKAGGFSADGVTWRKKDRTPIAEIRNDVMPKDDPLRMVVLPLNQVTEIMYKHLMQKPTAELKWNHKVTGLGQDADKAWVDCETPSGPSRVEADYIVGCDGANSQIRRSLFGDFEFPGWTWEKQIIASNMRYDFHKFGYIDSTFVVDPDDWYMAARITNDGLWRVTYGDTPGLTKEEYMERLPMRYEQMLPGSPKPGDYEVVSASPYKMHQRIAPKLAEGRFCLAADAAHLCNPFGGMGLTGGIADVGGLYECLLGIATGQADPSILEKYDEIRREIYNNMIDPISTGNFKRLWEKDPDETAKTDEFFAMVRKASEDKELAKQMQLGILALRHDMTQYYKTPKA